MDAQSVLLITLIVVAIAVCAVAVFALLEVVSTARSARRLFDDAADRLPPLAEKADVTIDAINAELLRVDAIITRVEEVTDTVSTASHVVREAASVPADAVNAVGTRLRRFVRDLRR